MNKDLLDAVHELEREKQIDAERLLQALEEALRAAYKKIADAKRHAVVRIDRETGDYRVLSTDLTDEELLERGLMTMPPEPEPEPEPEEPRRQRAPRVTERDFYARPDRHAVDTPAEQEPDPIIDWEAAEEQGVPLEDVTPQGFGRIAAQTAKQVIMQRIREAEREMRYEEYQDRVGDIVTGIVQQTDSRYCLVDLGKVEAILPGSEGVPGERYEHGARVKAVILEVRSGTKGPQIVLSRRSEEIIKELFSLEVPEIADGLVVIRAVAREPGYRSKIAVESRVQGVDPVGACVGPRGSRVRMVVSELRGEKIDIIPWNDEPARFIAKALAPARVKEVLVDDEAQQATVIVPDDQLSLAIGREGQNARLAAKLTGWKIDIKSETDYAIEGSEEYQGAATLAEFLQQQGYLERQMKALLKEGRVSINGIVVRRYERLVGDGDIVAVDGTAIEVERAAPAEDEGAPAEGDAAVEAVAADDASGEDEAAEAAAAPADAEAGA